MNVEFIRYQVMAVTPTTPIKKRLFNRFPEAARCPPLSATVSAGLWIYPPFDAEVELNDDDRFKVRVCQGLEAMNWVERMETLVSWGSTWWCSKIRGVFQIDPGFIFVTNPGEKLFLTQPLNDHDRGYFTQSGLVDSDFFKAPFTINLVPAKGVRSFSVKRSEPIAQLLSQKDILSALSFNITQIEDSPQALRFWRHYIDAVYGLPDSPERVSKMRTNSVYRDWLASHPFDDTDDPIMD
jgi:hypothetical protein